MKINEKHAKVLGVVLMAASIAVAFVFMYGAWAICNRSQHHEEIAALHKEVALQQANIRMLIGENNALRKVAMFEKTFLPYFSNGTKDKMLSVEGCLSLGG